MKGSHFVRYILSFLIFHTVLLPPSIMISVRTAPGESVSKHEGWQFSLSCISSYPIFYTVCFPFKSCYYKRKDRQIRWNELKLTKTSVKGRNIFVLPIIFPQSLYYFSPSVCHHKCEGGQKR